MKTAETSFAKANNEKKEAAEDARLKKVIEAKEKDLDEAKNDAALFGKIATRLGAEEAALEAAIKGGAKDKGDKLKKVQSMIATVKG